MPAYNAYLWKGKRLKLTAHDIAADDEGDAAKKSVKALRSRPGLQNNEVLRRLNGYLYGYGECPPGITLEIVKVADGPSGPPCVM